MYRDESDFRSTEDNWRLFARTGTFTPLFDRFFLHIHHTFALYGYGQTKTALIVYLAKYNAQLLNEVVMGDGTPEISSPLNPELDNGVGSFLSNILTPGSALHPTFLLIVDISFVALILILLGLLAATKSLHFVALTLITLALWASVKWCVL
jgi:hypothetical protein